MDVCPPWRIFQRSAVVRVIGPDIKMERKWRVDDPPHCFSLTALKLIGPSLEQH